MWTGCLGGIGGGIGALVEGRSVALEKGRNSFLATFSSPCLAWLKMRQGRRHTALCHFFHLTVSSNTPPNSLLPNFLCPPPPESSSSSSGGEGDGPEVAPYSPRSKSQADMFLPRITEYQSQKESCRSLSSASLCKLLQRQRPREGQ